MNNVLLPLALTLTFHITTACAQWEATKADRDDRVQQESDLRSEVYYQWTFSNITDGERDELLILLDDIVGDASMSGEPEDPAHLFRVNVAIDLVDMGGLDPMTEAQLQGEVTSDLVELKTRLDEVGFTLETYSGQMGMMP